MQKLLLACLLCSGIATAAPLDSVFKESSGHKRHKDSVFSLKEEAQPDTGFGLSFKHEETRKRNSAGLVKAIPILPVNAVMGSFTFNLS
jgi:hypothetical protein